MSEAKKRKVHPPNLADAQQKPRPVDQSERPLSHLIAAETTGGPHSHVYADTDDHSHLRPAPTPPTA